MKQLVGFRHQLEIVDLAGNVIKRGPPVFNRIPSAALDWLIMSPFGDAAPIPNIYCGLFTKNYIPSGSTSAADLPIAMGEFTQFAEPARPIWQREYNNAGTYSNDANPAVFTPTQDAVVYGSILIASADKGGNTGLVISVARFSSVEQLRTGHAARLKTSLTYLPTDVI